MQILKSKLEYRTLQIYVIERDKSLIFNKTIQKFINFIEDVS